MQKLNIAFRVDASEIIGIGHVMRCLTLADSLRERCGEILFICRNLPGNLGGFIENKKYQVHRLAGRVPEQEEILNDPSAKWLCTSWNVDAQETKNALIRQQVKFDWLIVDNYGIDVHWEDELRPYVKKIMIIDDLGNRYHNCDLLLDQNLCLDIEKRYEGIVPDRCYRLLGPKYALIRPEYRRMRKNLRQRDGSVARILVFMGGSDSSNMTIRVLEGIKLLSRPDIAIDVVVGQANSRKEEVKQFCDGMPNTTFYCQVDNMAELMVNADLAIGAGGTATWERCMVGLPTITVIVERNQLEPTLAVARVGGIYNLGWFSNVNPEDIAAAIKYAIENPKKMRSMGKKAMEILSEAEFDFLNLMTKLIKEDRNAKYQ